MELRLLKGYSKGAKKNSYGSKGIKSKSFAKAKGGAGGAGKGGAGGGVLQAINNGGTKPPLTGAAQPQMPSQPAPMPRPPVPAPKPEPPVPRPPVPAPKPEPPVPRPPVPAPKPEPPVPRPPVPAPKSVPPVPGPPVPAPKPEPPVPRPPVPAPKPEPPVPRPPVPAPKPEPPVPTPPVPAPKPEPPVPRPPVPAPKPEPPVPTPPVPAPKPEAPAPKPIAPLPAPEAPAPKPTNPIPKPEAPLPKPVIPVPNASIISSSAKATSTVTQEMTFTSSPGVPAAKPLPLPSKLWIPMAKVTPPFSKKTSENLPVMATGTQLGNHPFPTPTVHVHKPEATAPTPISKPLKKPALNILPLTKPITGPAEPSALPYLSSLSPNQTKSRLIPSAQLASNQLTNPAPKFQKPSKYPSLLAWSKAPQPETPKFTVSLLLPLSDKPEPSMPSSASLKPFHNFQSTVPLSLLVSSSSIPTADPLPSNEPSSMPTKTVTFQLSSSSAPNPLRHTKLDAGRFPILSLAPSSSSQTALRLPSNAPSSLPTQTASLSFLSSEKPLPSTKVAYTSFPMPSLSPSSSFPTAVLQPSDAPSSLPTDTVKLASSETLHPLPSTKPAASLEPPIFLPTAILFSSNVPFSLPTLAPDPTLSSTSPYTRSPKIVAPKSPAADLVLFFPTQLADPKEPVSQTSLLVSPAAIVLAPIPSPTPLGIITTAPLTQSRHRTHDWVSNTLTDVDEHGVDAGLLDKKNVVDKSSNNENFQNQFVPQGNGTISTNSVLAQYHPLVQGVSMIAIGTGVLSWVFILFWHQQVRGRLSRRYL